jgi:DNA polymerase-3 subunit delta
VVAIKASEVEALLARAERAPPVLLVYGPDAGLINERVNALIAASVDDPDDPFSLVRLDGEEVAADPGRLVDEAQTVPLFGGRRAVWVKAGGRNIAPAVEAVLALPPGGCRVVIEAGDLRRSAPLRTLCERAKNAAALPCYVDTDRDLARLIDDEMRDAALTMQPDARDMLIPLLGGDRAASRSEIRKLALYARGRGTVSVDDVAAVVSDASGPTLDDLVDNAFAGGTAEVEALLAKIRTADIAVGSIFFSAQRQLAQLHRWRTAIEEGVSFSLDRLQPPLHFRRRRLVEAALKQWTAARLAAAMTELAAAALASRRTPALAETIAARALLLLAEKARPRALNLRGALRGP